jgi:O-methyltransferase
VENRFDPVATEPHGTGIDVVTGRRSAPRTALRAAQELVRRWVRGLGFDVVRYSPGVRSQLDGRPIPDLEYYTPRFAPWNGYGPFEKYYRLAAPYTLVTRDRCWVLYCAVSQCLRLAGEMWECGVYKGGTARMLAQLLADSPRRGTRKLRLFDTFAGMPETDPGKDHHKRGDFGDTSLQAVRDCVGHADLVQYHSGLIPDTFVGLEASAISFIRVDVDIYQAVMDCCRFAFPRLVVGGIMVFDDYGFASCPGARKAVDNFFADTPFVPLVLSTGQAIVFKSCAWAAESQS